MKLTTKFRLGDWEIAQVGDGMKYRVGQGVYWIAEFNLYEDALDYVLFKEWQSTEASK